MGNESSRDVDKPLNLDDFNDLVDLYHTTQKQVTQKDLELIEARSELLKYKRDTSIDVLEGRIKILDMENMELKLKHKNLNTVIVQQKDQIDTLSKYVNELENVKVLCGLCEERRIDTVFVPCYHAYACQSCSKLCKNCPVCRQRAGINQLFLKGH